MAKSILTKNNSIFDEFLPFWYEHLKQWSLSGRLTASAQEALLLDGEPQVLKELVSQWSLGDFEAVPEIALLSNADINGAMGAYAQSTGKIYLNADWLSTATQNAVNAVLTEELGHHLDSKLNQADTQGDEGEYFSDLLWGQEQTEAQKALRRNKNDHSSVLVNGAPVAVEQASTTIRPASPGRTNGEWRNKSGFAALKADGSVITWDSGGGTSSAVASQLRSGISQIFSASYAFAALKTDGSAVTWGGIYEPGGTKVEALASQLSSGISQIFSTIGAFAALKTDGSVVTWGSPGYGADSSPVVGQISSGVRQIFSTSSAFAALKTDGSVVTWGNGGQGGDSSSALVSAKSFPLALPSRHSRLMAPSSPGVIQVLAVTAVRWPMCSRVSVRSAPLNMPSQQ